MQAVEKKAEVDLKKLLGADEHTLLEELGMRLKAAKAGVAGAADYDPTLVYDVQEMGPLDDLRELGRRLFRRFTRELHTLVCGAEAENKADRESIIKALGFGSIAVAGAITAVLVSTFAMAPAVATVVAALVVKRIIEPAGNTICDFWDDQLKKT